jgi:hypothetical protein
MKQQPQPPNEGEEQYLGMSAAALNLSFLTFVGLVIGGVCAWLFAFGGIDMITGEAKPDEATMRRQAADKALLTLSDLPTGWTAEPPEDVDPGIEFSEACKILDEDAMFGALAYDESYSFGGPAGEQVSSDASVFTNSGASDAGLSAWAGMWSTCWVELEAAFKNIVRRAAAENGVDVPAEQIRITREELPAPAAGERSVLVRLTLGIPVNGAERTSVIDYIALRNGPMAGMLVYSMSEAPPNADHQAQLAQLVASRMQAAAATLPPEG